MSHSLVSGMETPPESGECQSRDPRTSRLFVGQLVLDNGAIAKVRVRNLSEGGFGGRSETPLYPGQKGHMLLAGIGLVSGKVAWSNGTDFGLQFDERINPEQARIAPGAVGPKTDYVVPAQFKPNTDHRRPGFRTR